MPTLIGLPHSMCTEHYLEIASHTCLSKPCKLARIETGTEQESNYEPAEIKYETTSAVVIGRQYQHFY